jgi:uncharacterized membrane protein
MNYTGYELAFLILAYSFLGWIGETAAATMKGKTFVNRGFGSAPFCFIYGVSAAILTITMQELTGRLGYLFGGCMIIATAIEWSAAKILERLHQRRWWDYSNKRWNFDGYICLQYSLLWGALGTVALLFGNKLLIQLFHLLPTLLGKVLIWVLIFVGAVDYILSLLTIFHLEERGERLFHWSQKLRTGTLRLGNWLAEHVERRIAKAYPTTRKEKAAEEATESHLSFAKLFWLFVISSFLGDIVETLFCRVRAGIWMSRSSLVWGPFSVVWGLALVLATVLLHKDQNKSDSAIFLMGTAVGGAYEYICSVFSEIVFGAVFWDYSEIPFNLGGRINLLYCFFWGIAAVLWIKKAYPIFSNGIDWILNHTHQAFTWLVIVFMTANVFVSMAALTRYAQRAEGTAPQGAVMEAMDEYFGDERMERIYPNIILR